ncbi:hypothetical protein [Streptomyces sp. UG1]|uniref:hypothetical protein n=1 Tax=Streptomyces sp. UG1 TaxID=3417652 RepID=UPI003CF88179
MGNLHSYVSKLRRLLGGDRIGREPAGYRLRVAAEQVDIGRVERHVTAARAAASSWRRSQPPWRRTGPCRWWGPVGSARRGW